MRTGDSPNGGQRQPRRDRLLGLVAAIALLTGLFACVPGWTPPEREGFHRTEPLSGAGEPIGARECDACHDSFEGHYVASAAHSDCESCHGSGQLHAHTARAGDIVYPDSGACASCHQVGSKTLLGWTTSQHARANVLCSDCHDTHNREPRHVRTRMKVQGVTLRHAGGVTRMCVSCHPEVAAQFDLPSHHPMREGMIDCTACHSAHEDRRRTLGAATQVCGSCHQEVLGPWIYEHPPASEDCGYCHAPHGASADFLLEPSEPGACISCHPLPLSGAVHDPYAFRTRCTDCHNAVHGSYTDPHLRR
jgi:DmsE family decaheme c-type cytochrome